MTLKKLSEIFGGKLRHFFGEIDEVQISWGNSHFGMKKAEITSLFGPLITRFCAIINHA